MSENVLIFQDKQFHLKDSKNIFKTKSTTLNMDVISKILSHKSSFLILNPKNTLISRIGKSSIKRIISTGKLDFKDYLLLSFEKQHISIKSEKIRNENQNETNGETTEDEEENTAIIKDKDNSITNHKLNGNNKDIILDIKIKNENIFESDIPLLKDKINNTFSNIENLPKKYINLIILCNKVTINLDYLKCFYLILSFCGLLNLIYFFNITFSNIYRIAPYLENIYHFFCFPLGILLMVTGFMAMKK